MHLHEVHPEESKRLERAFSAAASRIAPVWPLENFVAVNPYMGFVDSNFDVVAQRFRDTHGADLTMPIEFYLGALDDGAIESRDIREALEIYGKDESVDEFVAHAQALEGRRRDTLQTVTDAASQLIASDLTRLMTDEVSKWASAYFDEGQAGWRSPFREETLFAAWKAEASIDRTPEVMGINGFRATLKSLSDDPRQAVATALEALSVAPEYAEIYLQSVSSRAAGWISYAARIAWDQKLYEGVESRIVEEFFAVLVAWEYAVYRAFECDALERVWSDSKDQMRRTSRSKTVDDDLGCRLILQRAYENAEERRLVESFQHDAASKIHARPKAQAIFCIDVRSETFRRHLEVSDSRIETLGFAGFFGMPIRFGQLGQSASAPQCPALVSPSEEVRETLGSVVADAHATARRESRSSVQKFWKSFAGGAVSCFGFVSPLGLTKLPRLFSDAFGWTRPAASCSKHSSRHEARLRDVDISSIDLETRVTLAAGALRGMSLTERFARIVAIVGHGASMVNNPHASGYDCGACGGRSGEPNARVAAAILNDQRVRRALTKGGIEIPADTVFVAALHDTTSDDVTLFDLHVPESHRSDVDALASALEMAGKASRAERAGRLGLGGSKNVDRDVRHRSRDWAQTRPEWGLAGCSSFVVAPRSRSRGTDLGGQSFLHDYSWQNDDSFDVLESIMTAPMVVTSWINLQYYASTVDNRVFGAGNKTLHNVVGTVGVLEGNSGDLRVGLPWQAVHDGTIQHDPLRLKVVIEAPIEAMNAIISRNESVRHLVDNGWLQLYAMNGNGEISDRYEGGLRWRALETGAHPEFVRATA